MANDKITIQVTQDEYDHILSRRKQDLDEQRRMYALMLCELVNSAEEAGFEVGVRIGDRWIKIQGGFTFSDAPFSKRIALV